jgi:hypothetical protein
MGVEAGFVDGVVDTSADVVEEAKADNKSSKSPHLCRRRAQTHSTSQLQCPLGYADLR